MNRPFFRIYSLAFLAVVSSFWAISCTAPEEINPTLEEFNSLAGKPQHQPGNYIVLLQDNSINFRKTASYEEVQAGMRKISEDLTAKYGVAPQQIGQVYGHVVTGFAATLTPAQVEALRKDDKVDHIEEDGLVYANAEVTQSPATWGLDRVDQATRPLSNSYSYTHTGQGVKVFILDTGIKYDHVDFEGRAIQGYSGYNDDGSDKQGHGTHVAGTVGSKTYGIAKKATLVSVKVLGDTGSGSWSTVIAGMNWVVANKGTSPAVVNMSLGGGGSSLSINTAVKNLYDARVPVIVAAGNDNADASGFTPANAPEAYAVGASTSSDARSSFSNFGTTVRLFAPGSGITSTAVNGGTATYSGTSMASPHVAGAAALLLQANPTATALQIYELISANATKNVINPNASSTTTNLLFTKSTATVTPAPEPAPITLSATWSKVSGRLRVNLTYSGFTSGQKVDIYRDNVRITTTTKLTNFTDQTSLRGSGSVTYKVCVSGSSSACSPEVKVDYL
ncbi:S8 family peptidase [Algoriphagus aquatilis]|uniref:S8 family peptidase n=1 Tax=Algoriphagus aquatilis TaxID=490186 RepID=A0ABW0C0P3_9BACT